MGTKLLENIGKELALEQEAREKTGGTDEKIEFTNSSCYCSDHSEHGAFILAEG